MKSVLELDGRTWLSKKEVRKLFGISESTFWGWRSKGTVPKPVTIGGGKILYWDREQLERAVIGPEGRRPDEAAQ